RLANAVAKTYITDQLEARYEAAQNVSSWLNERLGTLRARVKQAEEAVAAYASANHLMTVDAAGQTVIDQRLQTLNDELLKARADADTKEARFEQARAIIHSGGSADSIPGVIASPLL